jgi:hypothetical protein
LARTSGTGQLQRHSDCHAGCRTGHSASEARGHRPDVVLAESGATIECVFPSAPTWAPTVLSERRQSLVPRPWRSTSG